MRHVGMNPATFTCMTENSVIQHNNQLDKIYSSPHQKVGYVKFTMSVNTKEMYELLAKAELHQAVDRTEHGVVGDNGTVSQRSEQKAVNSMV